MEVTDPPPRKIEPPFSGSLPQNNIKPPGFPYTRVSSKRFQSFSVMACVSVQRSILNIWLLTTSLQNINWLPSVKM